MFVKFCGITRVEDAALAVALGAGAVGFIFAPSKRQVTTEQVALMVARLPGEVEKVGVVASQDAEEIAATARKAGLTAVQLHLRHDSTLTARLRKVLPPKVKVIQVVNVEAGLPDATAMRDSLGAPLLQAMLDPALWAVLLDTAKAGVSGGTGESFAWSEAKPVVREAMALAMAKRRAPIRLLLAGGLRPENVAEAVGVLTPWGVDVSSGVETSPGQKDPERMAQFITEAKAAGQVFPGGPPQ